MVPDTVPVAIAVAVAAAPAAPVITHAAAVVVAVVVVGDVQVWQHVHRFSPIRVHRCSVGVEEQQRLEVAASAHTYPAQLRALTRLI